MWGEIESPVKTQSSSRENEDKCNVKIPEAAVTRPQFDIKDLAYPQQPRQDTQVRSAILKR